MLYNFLGKVESAPLLDTMLKEIVGINAPKILVARSNEERKDSFYSEAGNTVAFFGTGLTLNTILNRFLDPKKLRAKSIQAERIAILGRSAALFSTSFAILWAMPFVRNYLTAKQTGSVRFTQVIGVQGRDDENSPRFRQAVNGYKRTAMTILGAGLAGSVLAASGARLAVARGWGKGLVNRLFDNPKGWIHKLTLKGGQFSDFGGWPALLFWGFPAYGGWIHASRDSYERKEQALKFINFVTCFFGPSLLLNRYFGKKLKAVAGAQASLSYKSIAQSLQGKVKERALKLWAVKTGAGLLSSIVLLGAMPQLINIYLTRQRLLRTESKFPEITNPPVMKFANSTGPMPIQSPWLNSQYPSAPFSNVSQNFGLPGKTPFPVHTSSGSWPALPVSATVGIQHNQL